MKTIELTGNRLQKIEKETFKGLINLRTIYLDGNQLHRIDKDTFKSLTSLKDIHLDSNKIDRIHKDTFKGLTQLEKIEMHNNKFKAETTLELCLEESVFFVAFKFAEDKYAAENDIEFIKKVNVSTQKG